MKFLPIRNILYSSIITFIVMASCTVESENKTHSELESKLIGRYVFDTTITAPSEIEANITFANRRSTELILRADATFNEIYTTFSFADRMNYFGSWKINKNQLELTRKGELTYRHGRHLRNKKWESEHHEVIRFEILQVSEWKIIANGDTLRKAH
jgi:hypothetical protein